MVENSFFWHFKICELCKYWIPLWLPLMMMTVWIFRSISCLYYHYYDYYFCSLSYYQTTFHFVFSFSHSSLCLSLLTYVWGFKSIYVILYICALERGVVKQSFSLLLTQPLSTTICNMLWLFTSFDWLILSSIILCPPLFYVLSLAHYNFLYQ